MPDSWIQFGPYSLGGETDGLIRGIEPVKLRPMSLQVLRYLSERPGQLVSKEDLLENVWAGRVISDSGLRLCVREIRAALGDNAQNPHYLETITGHGYRFLEGPASRAPLAESKTLIVGRDAELALLQDCYRQSCEHGPRFVMLAGEPGIGKTTVLNAFLNWIDENQPAQVIKSQCVVHYGKGEAYGPVLEAMNGLCQGTRGREIIRLFERLAPGWLLQLPGLLDPDEFERVQRHVEGMTPERMTREFCQVVTALAEIKLLIIAIEDLHWADTPTIDLLAMLAEQENIPLMLIGTYRPADAVLYRKNLRDTIRELKGRGLCHEILLELFSSDVVKAYLHHRLGGEVAPDLLERILQRSGGNPLFMVHLVEELIKSQALVYEGGCWKSVGDAPRSMEGIPESLQSLIERNLDALPQEQRRLLETASVVGLEFSAAAMTDALEQDVDAIDQQCELLVSEYQFIEQRGIEEWPDGTLTGTYRFHHPLYLEVVYAQIGDVRRVRLHRSVGERLESIYGKRTPEIATVLASHFDGGRDIEKTLHYRRLAAEQALARYTYTTAIEHLRLALDDLARLAESEQRDQLELDLLMLLGPVLIATGGYTGPDVASTYQRAMTLCELLGKAQQHFAALWNFAGYHMARGELARSRSLIEKAVEVVSDIDDEDLDLLQADAFTQQLFFEGKLVEAHEKAEFVVSRYQADRHRGLAEIYSQEDPGLACASIDAVVSWLLGYPEMSLDRLNTTERFAAALGNPHSLSFGLACSGMACQLRGDPQATIESAEALIAICTERDVHWTPVGGALKGWALARLDSQPEHLEMVQDGADDWLALGNGAIAPYLLALLAETQALFGGIDAALSTLEQGFSLTEKNGERWIEAELYRLKGDLLLRQSGRHSREAERCLLRSLEIACAQQARALELRTALSLCRLWEQNGNQGETRQLLQPILAGFNEASEFPELSEARELLAANS